MSRGESPTNENAAWSGGARQNERRDDDDSRAQPDAVGNPDGAHYENRRNTAACHPNRDKCEPHHADFNGVMVTDELPAGTRCWVNIRIRTDRHGAKYLSVILKPLRAGRK
jgi:hypothetical protein